MPLYALPAICPRQHSTHIDHTTAAATYLPSLQVLFAFEEAIGFMLGPMFRDKDGVSAAAVFAEMAAELYESGSSVSAVAWGRYHFHQFAPTAGARCWVGTDASTARGREVGD